MGNEALRPATGRGELSELRGGGATGADTVPPLRTPQRGPTGREDIEAAVAASGLKMGQRVELAGEITYLSADSKGRVWMRVQLDRGWSGVDCWAGQSEGVSDE